MHLKNRLNAPGLHRATLRTTHARPYSRHPFKVLAFGGDPYEPLEKAINIINKVLTVGESKSKTGANSNGNGNGGGGRERWVQFGTVATSHLSLQDLTAQDAVLDREGTARILQEYLSLPVEEYNLLDPKWVVREYHDDDTENNATSKSKNNSSFRVSVPLKDMIGVDICPQVSIEARPDPLNSQVTLIGSRAVLGSPGLDDMFKLQLVAVMRCRRKDRHLPGRPVQRLRQWAAKRRANNSNNKNNLMLEVSSGTSSSGGTSVSSSDIGSSNGVVDVDAFSDLDQLNFSEEEEDDGDEIKNGSTTSFRFSTDLSNSDTDISSGSDIDTEEAEEITSSTSGSNNTALITAATTTTSTTAVVAQAPLLDCKVQINMAVKVPGALRVVPNGLLGYAGSVITKTVLNAVLPNFLQLLSRDFKQWVAQGGRRKSNSNGIDILSSSSIINGEEGSGSDGGLFTPLISSASALENKN